MSTPRNSAAFVAWLAFAWISASVIRAAGPSQTPSIRETLKSKIAADKSFDNQELGTVLTWIHEEIFKQHNLSVSFILSERFRKHKTKAYSLKISKGQSFDTLLQTLLKPIDGAHMVVEQGIAVHVYLDNVVRLTGHTNDVQSVTFSKDGKSIISASRDKTIRIWDLSKKSSVELVGHEEPVLSAILSSDQKTLVSAGFDGLFIWDLTTKKITHRLRGHESAVLSVAFMAEEKQLVSAGADGTVRMWDIGTTEGDWPDQSKQGPVLCAASPDANLIASAGYVPTLKSGMLLIGPVSGIGRAHQELGLLSSFSSGRKNPGVGRGRWHHSNLGCKNEKGSGKVNRVRTFCQIRCLLARWQVCGIRWLGQGNPRLERNKHEIGVESGRSL